MFTEEKKNSQIFQDSNNVYKPVDEIETSNFIKEIYKKNFPNSGKSLSNTEKLSNQLLTLPLYPNMTSEEKQYLIESISEFFEKVK